MLKIAQTLKAIFSAIHPRQRQCSGTQLITFVLTGVRISGLAGKNVTEASFINVKTKSDIFTTKILFNFSAVAVTRENRDLVIFYRSLGLSLHKHCS